MKRLLIAPLVLTAGLHAATLEQKPARKTAPATAGHKTTVASKATGSLRAAGTRKRAVKPLPPYDPTDGDNVDGDDLVIRRAAVAALGDVKGSVVVVDPNSGRILTIVNQRLAFESGFTPCSTIKLVTSVAALTEHIVDRDTWIYTSRVARFNLTTALAVSNNQYFATLGNRLGFDRVVRYAQMLGLGERASMDIEAEQPGTIAAEPPKFGGAGMMTSFGLGFTVTPLELAALVSTIANGGTLYYLQYPRTEADMENFTPRVKRPLAPEIGGIADIRNGMRGAVDFGTARRANDPEDPIFGKTGTCTDFRAASHMGWFGSFNDSGARKLVVVVMLTGGHEVNGPAAAGVAGAIYRSLSEQRYFADSTPHDIVNVAGLSGDTAAQ